MLPDFWQTVHRLLLCCTPDGDVTLEQLVPALQTLRKARPDQEMWLLIDRKKQYELFEIGSQFNPSRLPASSVSVCSNSLLIAAMKPFAFDAAIIFTTPVHSPFSLAYLCYLAGVPIRLGQSCEFGGGVLSHCIEPPVEPTSPVEYNLHLLRSVGFPIVQSAELAIA